MRKIFAILAAAVYSTFLTAVPVLAASSGVTATLSVATSCDVSVSPSSIDFESTDGTSNEQTLGPKTVTLENNGNADTTLLDVSGTDWTGSNPSNTIDVTRTDYDDGSGFTDLTLAGTSVFGGILADGVSDTVDFHVVVPADQPADSYSQDITFTFEC